MDLIQQEICQRASVAEKLDFDYALGAMRYFVSDGKQILGEVTTFRNGYPPQWIPASVRNPDARVSFICPPISRTGEGGQLAIVSEEGKVWFVVAETVGFGTNQPFELRAMYAGEFDDTPEVTTAARSAVAAYLAARGAAVEK